MGHINVEIKVRCSNLEYIRECLRRNNADFKGIDHQIDTYFNVSNGRLKLREGDIENYLIYYERENQSGPKQSNVILVSVDPTQSGSLLEILTRSLGILVVVDKRREIYFINNIKFHIDNVKDLGTFVEIEAIDKRGAIGKERLLEQCTFYRDLFGFREENLVSVSYSDMLLRN